MLKKCLYKIIWCPISIIFGFKLMMTDKEIVNYGIAVVIGISFGNLILSIVENLIVPLLYSINSDYVEYGPGYILFRTNSTVIPYISNDVTNGIQIVKYNKVISSLLYFIIASIMTYWITSVFISYTVKKKCKYCMSDINHLAVTCPCCTRDIHELASILV